MILVTGASGFVGRALCPALVARGLSVRAQFRGCLPRSFKEEAALHAGASGRMEHVVTGELGPDTNWQVALDGCSSVIHLAAHAHDSYLQNPSKCWFINTAGTLRLAEQAAAAGVKRFVFASTVKVHGEGRSSPYHETDVPAPENAYAVSKWDAEQELQAVAKRTGMEIVIVRFPLVYGPGVGGNFLRLMRAVDDGMWLPFGCVNNRRSLIYVGNLVSALIVCLTHVCAGNKRFLVADGQDLSTSALIRQLAVQLEVSSRLLPVPTIVLRVAGKLARMPQFRRLLDSLYIEDGLIRRELSWEPPYSVKEGLSATATWFKAQR